MNPCTQNILASIRAGRTTIEGWRCHKQQYEQQDPSLKDEYQQETYQGACEALNILEQEAAQQAS